MSLPLHIYIKDYLCSRNYPEKRANLCAARNENYTLEYDLLQSSYKHSLKKVTNCAEKKIMQIFKKELAKKK